MRSKSNKRHILTLLVAFTLFFVIGSTAAAANSGDIRDLQEQRQAIQDNINEQRALLNAARNERNDTIAEIIALDIELAEVTNAYYEAAENLEHVTALLSHAHASLIEAQEQRELQFETLRSRLRSIHESSPMGYIELLLSSGSIADFLNNMEHFSRILEHDNTMLDALKETEARIARNTEEIAQYHNEVQLLTLELEGRIALLETTLDARGARIAELELDEATHQTMLDQLDVDRQAINLQITNAQAQADAARQAQQRASTQTAHNITLSADAVFVWPVQGARTVNSGYGYRTHPISGRREFHTGIDIRGSHGTHILAAGEGFVSFSGWMSGYGNTVIIDHGTDAAGNRVTTLYAHNSRNLVSQGQWVAQGQHIANVGSTGISTGPHLHFEVLLNGRHVNPGPYLGMN